jgi:nicotinate phosphoribosyltransferase
MSGALLTDRYELTMAASYLRRGMTAPATFSLFVRRLPPGRGFLVAAGIEDCLDALEDFRLDQADVAHLRTIGFDEEACRDLSGLRFTGAVHAVPEGRVVLAGEPLVEVTAPLPEAQVVESVLLNRLTFQTAIAAKAARCVLAAAGRIELVEFGLRRTHGADAALAAARAACMVGFAATSNVEAARRYGLTASGTMAHSYVEAFPTELDAFRAFAADFPEAVTFLVDTYDVAQGIANAARVADERRLRDPVGIRIDSGDLGDLAARARRQLDHAGLHRMRILVSGNLDEHALAGLVAAGAPVDAAGVGTRLGVSDDAPYLDSAYKLVAYDGRPVAKRSVGKATDPGAKQVFRAPGTVDQIGLRDEDPPPGTEPLLVPMMAGGRRTPAAPDPARAVAEARRRFEHDLGALPAAALRIADPVAPAPSRTPRLVALAAAVRGTT